MANHFKNKKSVFSFYVIFILTLQPTFAKVKPLAPPQCGRSNAVSSQSNQLDWNDTKIVGGKPALVGAWPWIGLLAYSLDDNIKFECACSLIGSKTAITAGHCVKGLQDSLQFARFGVYDLRADETKRSADYAIEKPILHPDFDSKHLENDIALLIFKKEVRFTEFIRPICLPIPDELQKSSLEKKLAIIAGWGSTRKDGPMNPVLLEAHIPIVSVDTCALEYKKYKTFVIDRRVICAGYPQGGTDACQGDSGDPMMLPLNNSYYLVGVVSQGYECAKPNFPGISMRVSSFLNFILDNLQ